MAFTVMIFSTVPYISTVCSGIERQTLRTSCKTKFVPVGRAVTRSSLEREVKGSDLGPVKSDTVLPTARHRCDISSKGAVSLGRNDADMVPTNSLHASAYYSEYNERFDLILFFLLLLRLRDVDT